VKAARPEEDPPTNGRLFNPFHPFARQGKNAMRETLFYEKMGDP